MLKRLISIFTVKNKKLQFWDDLKKRIDEGYFNDLPEDFSLEEFKKLHDLPYDVPPEEFKKLQFWVNLKKRIDAENFNDLPEDFSQKDFNKKMENVFSHLNDNKED